MSFDITTLIIKIPVLLFALTIHEYAHGRVALAMGDPTALRAGRLTMNPIRHIDPFGAICLFLFNFGWARPVPIDPRYFKDYRRATIYVSVAGPLANLCAALAAGLLVRYTLMPWDLYRQVLLYLLLMNIGLGLFNLIPIPPLDGSHILENLLPRRAAIGYQSLRRYGPLLLIGIILLDNFAHTGIISFILLKPMFHLAHLFAGDGFFRLIGIL
ncbi:site-2 protease family protein [Desulfatiglans anilini]|uniref:Peptidase n=1 Tax=Uncultured Desulfatiglans sp. TaxID=1748965 RepID=A0A653A8D7_UNCDX|nr:site-2 protease family protein [Desulfatiglans anilini]VBB44336.1 Peptidase [uncultured Desulfatiglans sp.]